MAQCTGVQSGSTPPFFFNRQEVERLRVFSGRGSVVRRNYDQPRMRMKHIRVGVSKCCRSLSV